MTLNLRKPPQHLRQEKSLALYTGTQRTHPTRGRREFTPRENSLGLYAGTQSLTGVSAVGFRIIGPIPAFVGWSHRLDSPPGQIQCL